MPFNSILLTPDHQSEGDWGDFPQYLSQPLVITFNLRKTKPVASAAKFKQTEEEENGSYRDFSEVRVTLYFVKLYGIKFNF